MPRHSLQKELVVSNETVKVNVTTWPILGLLGLIFITLKLTGVITWSWVWVLAPFWIPFVLLIVILIVAVIVWFIVGLVSDSRRNKSRKR